MKIPEKSTVFRVEHGTLTKYAYGCRCDKCKEAQSKRNYKYNQEHKEEQKERQRGWYQKHKKEINKRHQKRQKLINNIKHNIGCNICGETNSACLVFHHINPTTKELAIGHNRIINKILEEANKCIILCANCHYKLHTGQIELPT